MFSTKELDDHNQGNEFIKEVSTEFQCLFYGGHIVDVLEPQAEKY